MKWNNFILCIAASMLIVNSGTALAGPIRTFADLSAAILDLAEGSEDFIEAPENQLDPDATLAEIRSLRVRIEERIRTEIEGLEDAVLEFIINNSEEAVPGIGQAAYANMFPSAVFPLVQWIRIKSDYPRLA